MITRKKQPLYLQNTLTGIKEEFTPIIPGEVRMYNCGPTVYNEPHIGNLRAYIFADVLKRTLEYNDYKVNQVINITDVGHTVNDSDEGEDKMEKRAKETGTAAPEIAKKMTEIFLHNLSDLGIKTESIQFPRATDYIEEQIQMTKTLLEKGYAYELDRGIAFDVSTFKKYGALGNINIDELKAGARVEADTQKNHPADFWLWKFSDVPGIREQEWKSPWGIGYPGWHVECSAMSRSLLGRQLDIHTGGIDHIPVHHNNEIAQSEAVSGQTFVQYWMHNAHLMFDGKRFEKSAGHVLYLREVLEKGYSPLALRYLLLATHYHSEQNFTWEALSAANTALKKVRIFTKEHIKLKNSGSLNKKYQKRFLTAVNDDLSTPKALAVMWEMIKDKKVKNEDKVITLLDFDRVLGLQLELLTSQEQKIKTKISKANLTVKNKETQKDAQDVRDLLKQRADARLAKDWELSDTLRDQVKKLGYEIADKGTEQNITKIT